MRVQLSVFVVGILMTLSVFASCLPASLSIDVEAKLTTATPIVAPSPTPTPVLPYLEHYHNQQP